jgi:hypothetical protein
LVPACTQITGAVNDCLKSIWIPAGTNSLNGFPLLSRDWRADARHPHAIKVLLLGGIHGDEQTASAIVFKWLENIQKNDVTEFHWKSRRS